MLLAAFQLCLARPESSIDEKGSWLQGQVVQNHLTSYLVRPVGDGSNVAGCLGVYIGERIVLTSEYCLTHLQESYKLNGSNAFEMGSGQMLTVKNEDSFESSQGLGYIMVEESPKLRELAILPAQASVREGSKVTVFGYPGMGNDNHELKQYSTIVNHCNTEEGACFINRPHLSLGAPVFAGHSLFCIGSGIPGKCVRMNLARHLVKRGADNSNCRTTKEGGCAVLECDQDSNFCSQCYGLQNCTVKNGDCDGQSSIQKINCHKGGECVLKVDFSTFGYFPDKCISGHCSKGACGHDCSQGCTVSAGDVLANYNCQYSCNPDPEASKRTTWFIIGGVATPIALAFVAMISYIIYHHYKHPNGNPGFVRIQ